ncbi:MAG: hypothetical protein V4723_00175 [Pseudomonadota bacterium]
MRCSMSAGAMLAIVLVAGVVAPVQVQAQEAKPAAAAAQYPAKPADVASVDAIIAALYDVISGPAGKQRDWARLHSLFSPEARMSAINQRKDGSVSLTAMKVDDYIARTNKPFMEMGFFETELARSTETYGQLVHVFSTYEARRAKEDVKPMMRGINSIQLYHDGSRWWVTSLIWRAEDPSLPLPERYLKSR